MERQLTPSVFLRSSEAINGAAGALMPASENASAAPTNNPGQLGTAISHRAVATATRAQVLATRRFIIPKGNFLDCTLETAINSELPGMTTCVTAFDIFGADGKVVLLERGSKLVGETRGQVAQGMSRLFILWSEARTPTGVVVQLDSPGTDELGRAGVTGNVNNHFWARFGAALLVTVIDGALQGVAQHQESSGSTVILNPQGGQQVIDDILRNTINIPADHHGQSGLAHPGHRGEGCGFSGRCMNCALQRFPNVQPMLAEDNASSLDAYARAAATDSG